MASVSFTTKDGKRVSFTPGKKRKGGKKSRRRAHLGDATGECKMVKSGKGKCKIQLCHSGLGATGWTFVKGTRRCPA